MTRRIVFLLVLCLFFARVSPARKVNILMIGVTGSGKSTLGNTILGFQAFEVGETLDSCTAETSRKEGELFAVQGGIQVAVTDTGGLGDTEGRDELFADQVAAHVRSIGGTHGIVYVHNACLQKMDQQAREALSTMIQTLTNEDNLEEIGPRLSIMMTQCTDRPRRLFYESKFPTLMCDNFGLCDVPIFWYDDHGMNENKVWISWVMNVFDRFVHSEEGGWRKLFGDWVSKLPSKPVNVPSESQREILKREYHEKLENQERERKEMSSRLRQMQEQLKGLNEHAWQDSREKEDLLREIQELKNKLNSASGSGFCFSGDSMVIDQRLGRLKVKELQVGGRVATSSGWTTVTTFLHWHHNETVQALQIVHEQGNLTITPEHLLFEIGADGSKSSIPAKKLNPGAFLLTKTNPSRVLAVRPTTMDGYFAPLTSSGTILVDDVVASCYAADGISSIPHWVMQTAMAPLRMLPVWLSHVPDAGTIHPYARFLMMLKSVVVYGNGDE